MQSDPPDLSIHEPKQLEAVFALTKHPVVAEAVAKYRPWRKFKIIAERDAVDPIAGWQAVLFSRLMLRRELGLADTHGLAFCIHQAPLVQELLHRIDHATGGGRLIEFDAEEGLISDVEAKRRFMVRAEMVEAAESSIMEGAAITREEALTLLRTSRAPRSGHERMVVNNFRGMQWIKQRLQDPLTPEMLCELQRVMTDGAIDKPDAAGRFRRSEEAVGVYDTRDNRLIFSPPPADQITARLQRLCDFANANHTAEHFLHPVLKACILHFMIGYEHPFVDGNGRTARAVFFWSALRSGYRAFEYLTISDLVRKSPAKYGRAYVDSEQTGNDLTYFCLYHLDIITRAIREMNDHVQRERERQQRSRQIIRAFKGINLRQRLLLEHALRHPRAVYTVEGHAATNGITSNTARADLKELVKQRLLQTYKDRQIHQYALAPKAVERLTKIMHDVR